MIIPAVISIITCLWIIELPLDKGWALKLKKYNKQHMTPEFALAMQKEFLKNKTKMTAGESEGAAASMMVAAVFKELSDKKVSSDVIVSTCFPFISLILVLS